MKAAFVLSLSLAVSFAAASRAQADRVYAVSSLSIDEMAAGSFQSMNRYLKDLREKSRWHEEPGQLVIESASFSKCRESRFILQSTHSQMGQSPKDLIVRDGVTFYGCGEAIARFTLDRSGPGVVPVTDTDLFTMNLPAPTASESYHFNSTIYGFDIVSRATPNGRTSQYRFAFGSLPFHTVIIDSKSKSGVFETSFRTYDFDIFYSGRLQTVRFQQSRTEAPGTAPTFKYVIASKDRRTAPFTAAKYHEIYQSNIEGNTVEVMSSVLSNPPGFPSVSGGSVSFIN